METQLPRPGLAHVQMTVDAVIFTIESGALNVLFVKRHDEPFAGTWALPGGYLWEQETMQKAAARVLADKAGVQDIYIEQLYTFDDPSRDPRGRVISVVYFALAQRESLQIETGHVADAKLFAVDDLPRLAFDHEKIVQYALTRLRSKAAYTNLIYSLLPDQFTFLQLQQVYEIILGEELDRRNFRKKYMSLGLIEPTGEKQTGGRHRPAEIYRFVSRKSAELKRSF